MRSATLVISRYTDHLQAWSETLFQGSVAFIPGRYVGSILGFLELTEATVKRPEGIRFCLGWALSLCIILAHMLVFVFFFFSADHSADLKKKQIVGRPALQPQ